MMVIFLVGLVSMILMRTLRKDYARYSKEEEMDDMVRCAFTLWKLFLRLTVFFLYIHCVSSSEWLSSIGQKMPFFVCLESVTGFFITCFQVAIQKSLCSHLLMFISNLRINWVRSDFVVEAWCTPKHFRGFRDREGFRRILLCLTFR